MGNAFSKVFFGLGFECALECYELYDVVIVLENWWYKQMKFCFDSWSKNYLPIVINTHKKVHI